MVWHLFNKFLIRLDTKPKDWEDRTAMFCAFMIETRNTQSSTIKSYVSVIKCMLKSDGYKWKDDQVILTSLTRACKLRNDQITCKLPIQRYLLEMLLFEVCRLYSNQPYLLKLYQAIFILAYYGLMQVGELTEGDHPVKACHIHIGQNKDKLLLILYSSKTHSCANLPQKIKITVQGNGSNPTRHLVRCGKMVAFFCPFNIMRTFINLRGGFTSEEENLFIFKDGSPVKPRHPNKVLKTCLKRVNIDHTLYSLHSLRAERACDMLKQGFSIEYIKRIGCWKSNAVYKYLKV